MVSPIQKVPLSNTSAMIQTYQNAQNPQSPPQAGNVQNTSDGGKNISDLSDADLIALNKAVKTGAFTAQTQKIVGSLSNEALMQLKSTAKPANTPNSVPSTPQIQPQQGQNTGQAVNQPPNPNASPQLPGISGQLNSQSVTNQGQQVTNPNQPPIGINPPSNIPISPEVSTPTQNQSGLQDMGQKELAVAGGALKGVYDVADTVQSGITWAANKLGLLPDKGLKAFDQARQQINSPQNQLQFNATNQAMAQHPIAADIGRYGVDTAAAIGGTGALGSALGGGELAMNANLGAKLLNMGGNAAANTIAGAGMMPNDKRDLGGLIGAGASIGGDLASQVLSKSITSATLKSSINKIVSSANDLIPEGTSTTEAAAKSIANKVSTVDQVKNQLYNGFRLDTPNVQATDLANKLNTLSTSTKLLNSDQVNVLQEAADKLKNATSIADVHDILKANLRDLKDTFIDVNTSKAARNVYDQAESLFNDKLMSITQDAGVQDKYLAADKFYKNEVVPLQKSGAYKIANAMNNPAAPQGVLDNIIDKTMSGTSGSPNKLKSLLSSMDDSGQNIIQTHIVNKMWENTQVGSNGWDPAKALTKMTQLKKSFGSVLDDDHQNMIAGMQKVISAAGDVRVSSSGEKSMGGYITNKIKEMGTGGVIGGVIGTGLGHPYTGVVVGSIIQEVFNKAIMTQTGQQLLTKIGESDAGRAIAKQMIKSIVMGGTKQVLNP